MAGGVILENLSGRKLFVLVLSLLFCQLACFLIGGFVAPPPSATDMALASKCIYNESNPWSYIRGKGNCQPLYLDIYKDGPSTSSMANDIVFIFQIPTPRDNVTLDYSRWQQNLIGVLNFDIEYHTSTDMGTHVPSNSKLSNNFIV